VIVLYSPAWHQGVLGIVASRLVEEFYRPAFVFSVDGATAKGSARSIPPFHIYKGLAECAGLLLAFGGHSQAAGVKLLTENLPAFKKQMNSIVERDLNDDALTPFLQIDASVDLFEVTFNLVRELDMLEPFGSANEAPLLGVKGLEAVDPRVVGNSHLKMRLKQKSLSMDTIGFNMAELLEKIEGSYTLDAAFVPCINEWNGSRLLQLNLKAIRTGS
jgi:single-stranded-DNA-specific exonuclease